MDHTPGHLLLTGSGPFVIIVRPAGRIRPDDELKFAAAFEASLTAGWRYGVVTGWRRHVWEAMDAFSAERLPLANVLDMQGRLRAAVSQGPFLWGDSVERRPIPQRPEPMPCACCGAKSLVRTSPYRTGTRA